MIEKKSVNAVRTQVELSTLVNILHNNRLSLLQKKNFKTNDGLSVERRSEAVSAFPPHS